MGAHPFPGSGFKMRKEEPAPLDSTQMPSSAAAKPTASSVGLSGRVAGVLGATFERAFRPGMRYPPCLTPGK